MPPASVDTHPSNLPLPALVGLEAAQQALILLAIEPRLRGAVIAAPAGTGKSSLARGLRDLLAARPADEEASAPPPFVELPASIDTENLLGGLDLEATLRSGRVTLRRGVLARADGGIVYADGVNLLDDASANVLLAALDEGAVVVEREGISARWPARFSLIASYDPAEGPPRRHLLDRLGLIVALPASTTAKQRAEVARRNLDPQPGLWAEDGDFLRGLIHTARDHLPNVSISAEQVRRLSVTALAYGVEGHRADHFAVLVARAAAAYDLRDAVEDDDLALAVRLVILPRATRMPAEQPEAPPPQAPPPPDSQPDAPPEDAPPQTPPDNDGDTDESESPAALPETLTPPPEQILEALAADLPADLDDLSVFQHTRRGKSGSRGTTSGQRGRHVRSVPGDPKRARIDVIATLRAAAPWQRIRQQTRPASKQRVLLQMDDIRVKQYRGKAGALFCFVVDASGSMALHRMRQAKGAVHTLLQKAYVHRDRVALIAFRGSEAEVLMPPTQSVELARRALDLLPTGGGTPLAASLLMAGDLAAQAKMRGIHQTVLVMLTDGRANIPLKPGGDIEAELQQIGAYLRESNVGVIVVDTKRSYLSRGEARRLAEWLGGDYAYLPNATGEQVADLAAGVAGT